MNDQNEKKKSIAEIVALPTLAAGAGALLGGVAGGAMTRSLLDAPGIAPQLGRLARQDPVRKEKMLRHLQSLGAAGASTAGAVGSYALSEYVKKQMDRRKGQEKKASLQVFLDSK
jgi:hypothetical protein